MDDAAESHEPEFRKISDDKLQDILDGHKKWVEANYRPDLEYLKADLSRCDLQRHEFAEGTQLQRASFHQAQLQGAYLYKAAMQKAFLPKAQLQGAYLREADLSEANLVNVNFEKLVTKDGEHRFADLTDANFRDADLSNAQLATVNGLRAAKLGGTVLTNARLPEDIKKFDKLTHVAETSKNASLVFFGLLAASFYSWLTIATTTDVALITGSTSSSLPIINTNIALSGFYLAAPLILTGLYFYFHLYLQRLWDDMASLPAVFPDGEALDQKAYPWLLNGLVRTHFKRLKLDERPLTRVENFVTIFLAWWVVPLTLIAFWLRFLPRHDWWVTALQVALIVLAAWFGIYSYRLAVRTLSVGVTSTEGGEVSNQPFWPQIWRAIRSYKPGGMEAAGIGVAVAVMLSIHAAKSPGDDLLTTFGSAFGYETYAVLSDKHISTKPPGWTGRPDNAEVEVAQVKGADLAQSDLRKADARRAFLAQAILARSDLRDANLQRVDLRDAYIGDAVLARADLRNAKLRHADLRRADLSEADLRNADLSNAKLLEARLLDAELRNANLRGADLRRADLSDAILHNTDLSHAILHDANLSRADLRAELPGADLTGAILSGADLRGANLRDADLLHATLSEAKLQNARLWGANLRNADLTGADLTHADLSDADFFLAKLGGTSLRGANLCGARLGGARQLTEARLSEACGDHETALPPKLQSVKMRPCPVTAPPASPSPPPGSS